MTTAYFFALAYFKAKMGTDGNSVYVVQEPKLELVLQLKRGHLKRIDITEDVKIANSWENLSEKRILELKTLFLKSPYFRLTQNGEYLETPLQQLNMNSGSSQQLTIFDLNTEIKTHTKAKFYSLHYDPAVLDETHTPIQQSRLILTLKDENGKLRNVNIIKYVRYCNYHQRVSKKTRDLIADKLKDTEVIEITEEGFIRNLCDLITVKKKKSRRY